MTRKLLIVGAAIAALSVAACNQKPDETKGAATPAEQAATPDANPSATVPTPSDETKADDKDFDKKYADSQVDAHQAALNLLQRYAQDGDTAAIKAFAAATAPAVQEHLNMAEGLKKGFVN